MATGRVPTTANSPLTAKGDLFGYSTTQARVAVGNDGETLVADSSASVGLRYSATPSASNPFINSAMQVWQRGTSFAFNNESKYTADRMYPTIANTGATVSRQTTSDTTNLPFIQYCMRLARNSGTTNTGNITLTSSFETINSIPFVGKTVTFSFYARAGANYSSASNALSVYLVTGTGTDQNQATGYTGQATPIAQTATLTTTWQRFTYTGTIATTATEISPNIGYTPSGTAGANDYFEITGLQLDIGNVALPFRTYAATLQGELAACQRYYYRIGGTAYNALGSGVYVSTTSCRVYIPMAVTMRTSTAFTSSSASDFGIFNGSGNDQASAVAANSLDTNSAALDFTVTARTAGYAGIANTRTNTSAYVAFSAEL